LSATVFRSLIGGIAFVVENLVNEQEAGPGDPPIAAFFHFSVSIP